MSITYIFIWIALGLIFGLVEIFSPVKHRFICVTLGADVTAICNFFVDDVIILASILVLVSAISLCAVTLHHMFTKGKDDRKTCEQESR